MKQSIDCQMGISPTLFETLIKTSFRIGMRQGYLACGETYTDREIEAAADRYFEECFETIKKGKR